MPETKPTNQGASYWVALLPMWGRVLVAFMFLFTIWSVMTGFDLGNIMNKYADASLEQNKMQFEAQLQMQTMQFNATEMSNKKLDTLIDSVTQVTERMDRQAERMKVLTERLGDLEATVGLVVKWTCDHAKDETPGYCEALK